MFGISHGYLNWAWSRFKSGAGSSPLDSGFRRNDVVWVGITGLPDYGDWVACASVVGSDDEHVVGDGLGDDDAVEGVSVDVWQLEDA